MMKKRDFLRVVITGHVDHGKSTLVGRLFHDSGSLPEGKLEQIKAMCERRGMPFEWAFLMDSFQSERDQGITIDTSQIWFKSQLRDYVIIDAPGHREFIKNMITGAASADAALMLIDAGQGIQQQTRTHAFLLNMLGVRQIAVLVNKMDQIGYDQAVFEQIKDTYVAYLGSLGVAPDYVIPISAREGDNIVSKSAALPWYSGPSVLGALDHFRAARPLSDLPLRLPLQDIYKFDDRRILAGRILSGSLKIGDTLLFSPSNKKAKVISIENWPGSGTGEAHTGQSVGITLDEQLFLERGEVASHEDNPPIETNVFGARLFWLGQKPLLPGATLTLKLQTREVRVLVQSILRTFDPQDLSERNDKEVPRHGIADVTLRATGLIALDEATRHPKMGRFVLSEGPNIVAGGAITMDGYPDQRALVTVKSHNITEVAHRVTAEARAIRNTHRGGILWFTGLSGAGKSTIAMAVEQELFRRNYQTYVLDGDNIRHRLNANLGFSPEDRAENIRRVGEVAALFADAGVICITSFISPYRADRRRARQALPESFHEIYIKAPLRLCEERDPKGLYRRARKGEIKDFTGIDAPYEEPEKAELVIDTENRSIQECVDEVLRYVEDAFRPWSASI
ncbi:MAG TPA: adenylyl-sulfate kinase [Dongiaceae bacterium]|nr:adenylyl-sulfate kinase [Dongiaceae bacterium]